MVHAFKPLCGPAAPLPISNLDTDTIIRIERLTALKKDELGPYAFEALRYLPDGSENPDFPLNQAAFRGAPIVVAGANFGCGSSREHAVWAMWGCGIRCVMAPSFGDIFYDNCFQTGLLPIRLSVAEVDALMAIAVAGTDVEVDLAGQRVIAGGQHFVFEIDLWRKQSLIGGLDGIDLTLSSRNEIAVWQTQDRKSRAWAWRLESLHPDTIDP